jgi:hypothetical protein
MFRVIVKLLRGSAPPEGCVGLFAPHLENTSLGHRHSGAAGPMSIRAGGRIELDELAYRQAGGSCPPKRRTPWPAPLHRERSNPAAVGYYLSCGAAPSGRRGERGCRRLPSDDRTGRRLTAGADIVRPTAPTGAAV